MASSVRAIDAAVDRAELDRADRALRDREFAAVLRDRELAAMRAADLESYVAQRSFLFNMMEPGHPAISYSRMYTLRHNALIDSHDSMTTVLRHLQRGQHEEAMAEAREVVGSVATEDSEEESAEDDMAVEIDDTLPAGVAARLPEPVREALVSVLTEPAAPAATNAPQAFTGRSYRLD